MENEKKVDSTTTEESKSAELTNENQSTTVYAEAIKPDGEYDEDESGYLPLEKGTGGRSSWEPNQDPERLIETLAGKKGVLVRLNRNSKNATEGLTLPPKPLKNLLGIDPTSYKHFTQITIVPIKGEVLIGYIKNTEKSKGAYFPFRYLPKGISLPTTGVKLPVKVDKVIIG